MEFLLFAVGLVAFWFGAEYLVKGSTAVARRFSLSPMLIGLTIVGFGTSLPEMATSIIAAIRGQREIAVGNIVGSNIYNIPGLTAAVAPIMGDEMDPRFLAGDMLWVLGTAVGLTLLALAFKGIPRIVGAVLLAAYVAYVWLLIV